MRLAIGSLRSPSDRWLPKSSSARRGNCTPSTVGIRDRNYEFWGDQTFYGENPPQAAVISWLLKRPVGEVALRITDASGRQVREISGQVLANANKAGLQSACWDLRVQPVPAAAPVGRGGDQAGRGGDQAGRGGDQAGRGGAAEQGGRGGNQNQPANPFGAGCGGGGGFGGGSGFGGGGNPVPGTARRLQRVAGRGRQVHRDAPAARHGRLKSRSPRPSASGCTTWRWRCTTTSAASTT